MRAGIGIASVSFNSLIKSRIVAHLASERRLLNRRDRAEELTSAPEGSPRGGLLPRRRRPLCPSNGTGSSRLRARYEIVLQPLISRPPDGATPARAALQAIRLDATRLAARGLDFPETPTSLTPEQVDKARSLMAATLDQPNFAETAVAVGTALWQGATLPDTPMADPRDAMARADALLRTPGPLPRGDLHSASGIGASIGFIISKTGCTGRRWHR